MPVFCHAVTVCPDSTQRAKKRSEIGCRGFSSVNCNANKKTINNQKMDISLPNGTLLFLKPFKTANINAIKLLMIYFWV